MSMSKSSTIKRNKNFRYTDELTSISVRNIDIENKTIIRKPEWMKIKLPVDFSRIQRIKEMMRKNNLYSVCEEASCPNLTECFNRGTATFMILGKICTRRCPFCNVYHGRPTEPDIDEPQKLSEIIFDMALHYVVITSVNRDDLRDGGARHFAKCITAIREKNSDTKIEILVPDFRGCVSLALEIFNRTPPDVFNHNLENVPRLYHQVRPGADYIRSLKLLKNFKKMNPSIPSKSGLMVGLGETNDEIVEVMQDLYSHGVTILTLGQYLQPSRYHLPVQRYVSPSEFDEMRDKALEIGFTHVACGPFVRSSYYADLQQEMNKK